MTVDPVLLIVIPLIAAFLVPMVSLFSRKIASFIPLIALLAMGGLAGHLLFSTGDTAITSTTGGFDPPWGISLVVTPLGALVSAMMIFVGIFVSLPSTAKVGKGYELWYNVFVMMTVTGAVGMVITGDLFNLFVFLEITSIGATVLAVLPRDGETKGLNWRGAASFAIISAVASFLILAAIALLYGATSTLNMAQMAQRAGEIPSFVAGTAFLLMFVGFGIEAEIFPLNGWAPDVYRGSRWGTASIFSGVVGKAGLIALLRISFIILGPAIGGTFPADLLMWAGLATFIVGEAAAFTSKDLYRMLGFSSIGAYGLILAAFASGSEMAIQAGVLLMLGHMLAKPILFSMIDRAGAGKRGDVTLSDLEGLGRRSTMSGVLFVGAALAMLGMPPSPTFWGKVMLFSSAGTQGQWALAAIVALGTLLEAGYMGRLIWKVMSPVKEEKKIKLPVLRLLPGLVALGLIILIGIQPAILNDILDRAAQEFMDRLNYIDWGGF